MLERGGLAAVLATLALASAACGGDDENDGASKATTATPPARSSAVAPPGGPEHRRENDPEPRREPDAGDEEGIRVPVRFVLRGGRATPRRVAVPAFLPIELTVVNRTPRRVRVALESGRLGVAAGRRASVRLGGLKKGSYPLRVDGRRRAVVVSGAQPGP